MSGQRNSIQLFAPEVYPISHAELRAYTIAAFRVAQESDQLSLIPMSKPIIDFLVKGRALRYWKESGWLSEDDQAYYLTAEGLVLCQSALAQQLPTHNTSAANVEFWVNEFTTNSTLLRCSRFDR